MVSRNVISSALLLFCIAVLSSKGAEAFTTNVIQARARAVQVNSALSVFGKKKGPEEDLSYIESRDLTREEMLEINRRNEEVMNRELGAMTGISVLFSIPILYLCWVAFFSE